MREPPPAQLVDLLKRLGLASQRDWQSLEPAVDRLAGDLPRFQSVWVDALRKARWLTHYQAAEIMASRGDALRVGRFVIADIVQRSGFTTVYKAEDVESHDAFRLATFDVIPAETGPLIARLEELCDFAKRVPQLSGLIEQVGHDGRQGWAAARWIEGTTLAEWMLHHGRFPPEVVLEVARAMLGDLAAMEAAGLVHGDIRVDNILLLPDGGVCLPHAGLRGIIRPHEGIAHCDLAPEACSGLAPERVAGGAPPTIAGDLFASGCVWWHMLCGRPPLGGADALSRLRAAQSAAIDDYQQWTAGVPEPLGAAVTACLKKDPRARPTSMAALARQLGPLRRGGRQVIARCLQAAARPHAPWLVAKRAKEKKRHPHLWTGATLAMLAMVSIAWPLWVAANRRPAATGSARHDDVALQLNATAGKPAAPRGLNAIHQPGAARDSAVMQAGYFEATAKPQAANELVLAINFTTRGDNLLLRPGMIVRAARGRARIAVPRDGLTVQADRLTFENIDFVPDEAAATGAQADRRNPTLIRLSSPECTFIGCSFQSIYGQSASGGPELSTAITWEHGTAGQYASAALGSGRINVKNCVFRRVAAGVESRSPGAMTLNIANTLHLGPGPLIRLVHCPAADEPLRITLSQVTLREADAFIEGRFARGETPLGEITVAATNCVFAPRDGAALLLLACDAAPEPLLREVKWSGQGSVVAPRVAFCRWRRPDDSMQSMDDATISISGLVRGQVEFARPADGDPASSRILDCQAPLADTDSLGAGLTGLPSDVDRGVNLGP